MHYSAFWGSVYLHTDNYCICTQLSRSISVDFIIRECAACALEHLDRPLEECLLFSSLKLEMLANTQAVRQVGLFFLTALPLSSSPSLHVPLSVYSLLGVLEKAALHPDTAVCSSKSLRFMINSLIYINDPCILFSRVSDIIDS